MNISKYDNGGSRWLSKADVDPAVTVTIKKIEEVNVARHGEPEKLLPAIHFKELGKTWLLSNKTNREGMARLCGSKDTDDWPGHVVVLYVDPEVEYEGEIVGGIRIRTPKKPSRKRAQKTTRAQEEEQLPF